MSKTLRILGTRGVPAAHGGFETFAEYLALHLRDHGWRVIVYCQDEGDAAPVVDQWNGIERVRIAVRRGGSAGSILFDWKATLHAAKTRDLCLTLGYNTALFCTLLRLRGVPNLINMDGIEWSRAKWGPAAKTWFWLNDWFGCLVGNHLVADHPQIEEHLATRVNRRKITTIAYGADAVTGTPAERVQAYGLEPGRYLTLIARPEPENSVLEVVQGFSAQPRSCELVVLGNYSDTEPYHRAVRAAAGPQVKFLGAIYDKTIVRALREHSLAYIHGHQVGGTNPSLVEALGAGNAVIAHDNRFNRWVAGEGALYFSGAQAFASQLDTLLNQPGLLAQLRQAVKQRYESAFTWPHILGQYEALLQSWLPRA